MQERAQPRARHAVRLVAQPVHRLRSPLHVLLRPPLRDPGRSPGRRPLRPRDPRQDERRRRSPAGARPTELEPRGGRDRHRDRPLPALRGTLSADPRVPRGARARAHAVRDHHPRPDDLARHRRPAGGCPARAGHRLGLRPHARRARLAHDRAGHRPSPVAARGGPAPAASGIAVGVAVAPVLPGLSDGPDQLRDVVHAARDAGAQSIWCAVVHLRSGTREHFLGALARDWPEEVDRYAAIYGTRAYPSASLAMPVKEHVRALAAARAAPRRPTIRPRADHCQLIRLTGPRAPDNGGGAPAVGCE